MPATILLYDAYSLIYRAFYAIRTLTAPDGAPVNAVYGLTKMLKKMVADHQPARHVAAFDLGAPQKRLTLLPTYKSQRPPTPPELDQQLPSIRAILDGLRIPVLELEGVEADDIIATLAVQAAHAELDVLIASNDKDFMQLVGPRVRLLRPDGKETSIVDAQGVRARYGVAPEQIVDFLSLVGDSVDNIPGVPGVGEKTAAQLLQTYGGLDGLLTHASEISKPKLRESLAASAAVLLRNRELIRLDTNLNLPLKMDDLRVQPPDNNTLRKLYQRLGFKSLQAEAESATVPKESDLFG